MATTKAKTKRNSASAAVVFQGGPPIPPESIGAPVAQRAGAYSGQYVWEYI
jgi:hypothetical protein